MSLESILTKLVAAIEDNTAAIREQNGSNTSAPTTTTAEPPKPKSDQKKSAPKPSEPAATTEAGEVPDKKTLTQAVIKVAKTKGREVAGTLLAEFGATKVPELKEEDYASVYAKAQALLA